MPLRVQLLTMVFLLCIPICLIRPFFGVVLWTIVAFANPQSYSWGAWAFPWAVAAGAPTLTGMLIFGRGWRRLLARESILLMLFWAWTAVTTYISVNSPVFEHHANHTLFRMNMVSKILIMTFATMIIIKGRHQLRIYLRAIACCFGVFVVKAFPAIVMSGGTVKIYGPADSMIADNNDYGLALNMTLPLYFFLAQIETNVWLKRLFWSLFVLTIPSILCTYSRGALLGLVVLSTLMILQLKQRWVLIPIATVIVVVVMAFAPSAWRERMDPTKEQVIDGSANARLVMWNIAWEFAQDYPITGGGFATFTPEVIHAYLPNWPHVLQPHSIYFQVLAEHGFVGIGLYLLIVASTVFTIFRLEGAARREGDSEVVAVAQMIRFSITGFLTSGAFLGLAYFDYYFALLAGLVVLKDVAARDWESSQIEEPDEPTEDDDPHELEDSEPRERVPA